MASIIGYGTADVPDVRTRTFVHPTRIVWESDKNVKLKYGKRQSIENAQSLLGPKRGQVPEYYWGSDDGGKGCTLTHNGIAPGILLDFGRELHGGLNIEVAGNSMRGMRVRVRFGESAGEAMAEIGEKAATNDHAIRDLTLDLANYGSTEIGNTGFRFVRIDLITSGHVTLDAVRAVSLMRPMERIGAFRCSDERVNQVFETCVRTVHLCCQDKLWDGIKRDRLVWMGDTHPETMTLLAVFGADPVLIESLDFACAMTPPNRWMNGMGPYTLWWIRNEWELYRYSGDITRMAKRRDYFLKTLAHVASTLTPTNTIVGMTRPFLDWPTEHNRPAVTSGMLALYRVAELQAAELCDALNEPTAAAECRALAARIATLKPEAHGSKQAAAMLALAGLRDPHDMFAQELGTDGVRRVSTFYGYYMLEAMSIANENQHAIDTVRDYWGGMLDVGATSFWENFDITWTNNCTRIDELPVAGKNDIHGDYGEFCYPGYRHSLCHGWSGGPAAWLIHHVLGINATKPGCTEVRVTPFLGNLDWAEGALATPKGPVRVRVTRRADGTLDTQIDAPQGVTIVR